MTTHDNGASVKLGRYPVTAYPDGIEIDLSKDDGGWSGCGHPGSLWVDRADLERILEAVANAR